MLRINSLLWLILVVGVIEGGRPPTRSVAPRQAASSLDDIMDRLDDSVQEKKRRLRGLPTIHYRINEGNSLDEGPTIIHSGGEEDWDTDDETHIETLVDYVNVAPWTRRTTTTTPPPLAAQDLQNLQLATENAKRVKIEGKCEVPQMRCETVRSDKHPLGVMFWPRCALLHRCDEGTGCCLAHKTCAPAETENVQMYFYVLGGQRATIDVMTFVNHTRCSCQLRSAVEVEASPVRSCHCMPRFTPTTVNGQCVCDCDPSRSRCRRYRRGRRTFSSSDCSCIANGECGAPRCDYGVFQENLRRCPKRRERDIYTTVNA